MILDCQHISKAFGLNEVLKDISFHIEEHEKTALIGMNGAGKSTLLRIIMGEMEADHGQVVLSRGASVGYLAQHQIVEGEISIYDEVLQAREHIFALERKMREMEQQMTTLSGQALDQLMEAYHKTTQQFENENGYACRSQITGVLKGLGFREEEFSRPLSSLSGGQKTRVELGRLLITEPDLLLLDEPTNHLDLASVNWLETYLLNYSGAVLLVSHDRFFLDRVVGKVVEIEHGRSLSFQGNYTLYHEKKAVIRKTQYRTWLKQQAEIQHQKEVIEKLKSFNREKSIKRAESREKQLDHMELVDKPMEENSEMRLRFRPHHPSGNDVLSVAELTKSYPGNELFRNQSFELKKGERVAIIGDNGTGKTTMLKIINGMLDADAGSFQLGSKVTIGYYDQEQQLLDNDKTIFQEIADARPKLTGTEVRNTCAAFLFMGDDVFQKIGSLSGGERGRVSLAKLMLSEANFLILDEPTNHLDILSRELLEDALNSYEGTVLCVSHDRYFINATATRILELYHGTFINYIGNYDYYLEKYEQQHQIYHPSEAAAEEEAVSETKLSWKARKEEQAKQRKKENALKKLEQQIEELEGRLHEIDAEFALPETGYDLPLCQKLSKEQAALGEELESLYEKWEELAEEA